MAILFKDEQRHRAEWEQLKSKNHYVTDILTDLAAWVYRTMKKDVTITMIYRRQEEQDAIYKGTKNSLGVEYDKHPWKSDHQFWNCVDIRSKNFTPEEIEDIEYYLNTKHNPFNKLKWTAKCHTVAGGAPHFHIQFIRKV